MSVSSEQYHLRTQAALQNVQHYLEQFGLQNPDEFIRYIARHPELRQHFVRVFFEVWTGSVHIEKLIEGFKWKQETPRDNRIYEEDILRPLLSFRSGRDGELCLKIFDTIVQWAERKTSLGNVIDQLADLL